MKFQLLILISVLEFPGGTNRIVKHNTGRVIDVWTDEYKNYFRRMNEIDDSVVGDVNKRVELRKNLQCKSFKWYLENIYPEAPVPIDFVHVGRVNIHIQIKFLNKIIIIIFF